MNAGDAVDLEQRRLAYLYGVVFVAAVALTLYVFAFSN